LVAVCQAFQSLLTYQSDRLSPVAAPITLPQKRGSEYQEGGMTSPDGHCRTSTLLRKDGFWQRRRPLSC